MIKLVVFDWNGTLFADVTATAHGANARMEYFGYPPLTANQYRAVFEVPISKVYEKLGLNTMDNEQSIEGSVHAFHDAYEERAKRVRTRSGARTLLGHLAHEHIRKIIFSNHTLEGIEFQLKRLKILGYFDAILANHDRITSHHMGKKARLIAYLKAVDIKPGQILIIGDTPEEIHIGQSLGLHTVAISGGFCDLKRLKAAKPDFLIHKLNDLIPILEQL